MDPNVALQQAREYAEEAYRLDEINTQSDPVALPKVEEYYALRDALERYRSLDEWLTGGGFLPSEWDHKEWARHR